MHRFAIEKLEKWKNTKNHKPLIINGARQVGKTYLMKEFAENYYDDYVYVNFEQNKKAVKFFDGNIDPYHIVSLLEYEFSKKINKKNTLIIFDEIQECSRALTSLKYFNENAPEYDIICSGSTMGITLHKGTSFPVGKVDLMKLYPMCFEEFLYALGEEKKVELLQSNSFDDIRIFNDDFVEKLKLYYYIGGMPKVILDYIGDRDLLHVKENQNLILQYYKFDFGKYADANQIPKLNLIFDSIATQLSKENSKFIYGVLKKGARASEYEYALQWLIDSNLIYKVYKVTTPRMPLKAYCEINAFKIYFLDVGLLSCMSGLTSEVLTKGNDIFVEFKGSLAEQYVLQEMKNIFDYSGYYYTNKSSTSEVDFLLENADGIIPIEIKSGKNLKAKSLGVYIDKFNPKYAIRASLSEYTKTKKILDIPLYSVKNILESLNSEKSNLYNVL